MKMDLKINRVTWVGLMTALIGGILQLIDGIKYSINEIQVFPFIMIPIGVLISLVGFMKK